MIRQPQAIEALQRALDYRFQCVELLEQALTHRSAKGAHNERLEFLGDSVLGFVTAALLYAQFPKASEGQLTRLRAQLVKEKTLAEIARELELGELLRMGGGELKSGGYRRASILSDALEALFGAIYLDGGIAAAEHSIKQLYQNRIQSLSLESALKDSKTRLQEWLQSRKQALPDYQVTKEEGQDHNKVYWVQCHVKSHSLTTEGNGSSRRKAEQQAAAKMMKLLLNEGD
jgi:ribonuclease-3